MSAPLVGSLFSGVAGLDRAVEAFFDAEVAFFVEWESAPSKVLEYRYPGVPNYGDVTKVDWSTVPRVHILTMGFPCQDVSLAGARRGLGDGTRSGLWSECAKAIDALRPSLVVIENVRGLLSAKTIEEVDETDSESEYGSAGVGGSDGNGGPVLNAFGRVLLDLAELGYVGRWTGLRAADAGAPHGRFRVFCIAYPAGARRGEGEDSGTGCGNARSGARSLEPERSGRERAGAAEDSDVAAGGERWVAASGQAEGGRAWADVGGRGRASAANSDDAGREELGGTVTVRAEHASAEHAGSGAVTDARSDGRSAANWGPYRPAIERWEAVMGRHAPAPTRPDGRNGGHRLNPELTEWMMGWPEGWVTDPAIGLTRNEQLKACGNGVVTQQAFLALSVLIGQDAFFCSPSCGNSKELQK